MKAKKAIMAFDMLKNGISDEAILEICSKSTLKKVKSEFNKRKKLGQELVLDKYPQKPKSKKEKSAVFDSLHKNEFSASDLRTINDLISYCEINTNQFECVEFTSNVYGKVDNPSIQCKGVFKSKLKSVITIDEYAEEFRELVKEYKPNHANKAYEHVNDNTERYAAVLPIVDLHFGSRSIINEVGSENNLESSKNNLINSMLFHRNHIFKYNIEKVFFPILGDFFNVDNTSSSTTKGTFQEETTSLKQTFRKGCKLIIGIIDSFAKNFPVEVYICRGNHDEKGSFYLQCFLEAFYKDSNVFIDTSDEVRKYAKYGNTCLGFGHGDTKSNADYLSIMLSEIDAFDSDHREFLVGHVHHTRIEEKPGIKIRRVGSLCPSDTWHKKMGYVSKRSSEGYIVSKNNGIVCNTTFYI